MRHRWTVHDAGRHPTVLERRGGRMVVAMSTDVFATTTGDQVPVDGGDDRVV